MKFNAQAAFEFLRYHEHRPVPEIFNVIEAFENTPGLFQIEMGEHGWINVYNVGDHSVLHLPKEFDFPGEAIGLWIDIGVDATLILPRTLDVTILQLDLDPYKILSRVFSKILTWDGKDVTSDANLEIDGNPGLADFFKRHVPFYDVGDIHFMH